MFLLLASSLPFLLFVTEAWMSPHQPVLSSRTAFTSSPPLLPLWKIPQASWWPSPLLTSSRALPLSSLLAASLAIQGRNLESAHCRHSTSDSLFYFYLNQPSFY